MTFPRSIPWYLYVFALALGLFCLACSGIVRYGASEYERGRESVIAGVRVDTVTVGVVRAADSTAKAKTDTIVKRITVTRWKVDTVLRAVPDSLRSVPEIAHLVTVTKTLTAQVDTLTHTLDLERATSRLRASVDSAALVSAQIVIVSHTDTIMALKKRPQWRTVALGIVGGVVVGLLR